MKNSKSTFTIIFIAAFSLANHNLISQCTFSTCDSSNTFLGVGAGFSNSSSGNLNSFFGVAAGQSNTSGDDNSFFGDSAGAAITSSSSNSFFGSSSGANLTSGNSNTFMGAFSGLLIGSGSNNICLGNFSGPFNNVNPSDKLYIDVKQTNDPLIYGEFDNELVRVNGNFEVEEDAGIGVNNPAARLHVNASSTQNPIRADLNGQMKFHVSTTGGVSIGTPTAPPGNGLLVSGNTGIGQASPAQKLDVNGAIKIGTTNSNVNGSIRFNGTNFQGHKGNNWVNLDAGGVQVWSLTGTKAFYNQGNVGIGTTNPLHLLQVAGDVAVAGEIIAPSDRRLKTNITSIEDALKIIEKLQPKQYDYKEDKVQEFGLAKDNQYGLIAQELEAVLPSLVSQNALKDKDGTSYKGIEYTQLIPILTQAIKELSAENQSLKQQQADHDIQSAKLHERMALIEAKINFQENANNN